MSVAFLAGITTIAVGYAVYKHYTLAQVTTAIKAEITAIETAVQADLTASAVLAVVAKIKALL